MTHEAEHPIVIWAEVWRRELALRSSPGWTIDRETREVEGDLMWKAALLVQSGPDSAWSSAIGIEHEEVRAIQAPPQLWGEAVQLDERMVRELLTERLRGAVEAIEAEGVQLPADLLEAAGLAGTTEADDES